MTMRNGRQGKRRQGASADARKHTAHREKGTGPQRPRRGAAPRSALLNADEAFAMAVQIESNAAAFYRRAAGQQADAAKARFLEDLAAMEDGHRQTFVRMRVQAADRRASPERDLNPEGGLFLSAIAAGYRVEGAPAVADKLTGRESLGDILETALQLEKESVLFYLGLSDALTTDSQRRAVRAILREEKAHVATLRAKLGEMGGKRI